MTRKIRRFICFRSGKKKQELPYGTLVCNGNGSNSNVVPSARMVVRGPIEEGLTLQYVTKNIIALTSPDEGTERAYVESLKTATINLKNKHSGHYKVWSVSRSRNDVARCLDADQCGWPPGIAPPLDRLCAICKGIEKWLAADCENVVVIHCKGDRGRVAMVISAYMHYNAICSGDDCVEERFCMQRFSERYIGANGQPSQKRYINYFASLLSGKIRVNPAPMYLHRITLTHTVGRILAFKVYERLDPVYQSCEIASKDSVKLDIEGEVRLRGDIIIKCFIINNDQRKLLFVCQLNTCALEEIVKPLILTFHKEELDLVFADPNFDNRSVFELHVSSEPVRNGTIKRKSLQENRTNSYGDFDEPEDSSVPVVEYSEIRKKPFSLPLAKEVKEQDDEEPSRDADIGKGRDAEEERDTFVEKEDRNLGSPTKNNKMPPPPVPPKPRSASAMDEPEYQHQEPRGVLPAHVRPLTHRPPSPKEGQLGRNTPSAAPNIEPDTNLIGKDRYDKASKCFSYVPAKVLKETFENPRPPRRLSLTRTIERREDYVDDVRPDEIRRVQLFPADIPRRDETPKWEDEIEAAKQQALLDELARIPTRSQSVAAQPYYMRNDYSDDRAEKPLVFDQAQRATATPTSTLQRTGSGRLKTRYGSYRQLNDEQYSSDMDDLCDPDYYLNYTNGSKTAPRPPPRQQHMGAKSVEFPRKHYQPVEKFTDPLDDILASTMSSERTSGGYHAGRPHLNGPMPPASSYSDLRDPRDQYRNRNCRSVAAVSGNHERTHTVPGEHRNDVVDAADDWLNQKLKKAKSNRNVDPDLARRRTQEKVLLEELKAKDEKVNEYADPRSTAIDPLAEFKREEERLKNTHSPFDDSPRRARQIRGKPPTPPPRERSRSPARSDRLTPSVDNYRSLNGGATSDDFDFSTLNSIVQPSYAASDRPDSRGAYSHHGHSHLRRGQSFGAGDSRPPFQFNESSYRSQTPTHFISGQERVAAAIYRAETPAREMYSSGTLNRSETPCGRYFPENSVVLQRSETPAFPVSRETPLPFHPLLYSQNSNSGPSNGGGTHGNGTHGSGTGTPVGYGNGNDRASTLNNRAASPRSQYGQFSRRSSLTSVDPSEIIHHHPVFVKDTSKYWYKPTISREQAINMLRDKPPGTFVVRDSNSFPGAFGLALKVAQPPPGVQPGDGTELVRHFLIEPSPKGVKLKGCNNEPVFGSLSALVYQHSITPLALPAKLLLPDFDPASTPEHISAAQALLEQGAACNVSYVGSIDVESLTGAECIKRSISYTVEEAISGEFKPVSVHFKVSSQGVTLTDNTRKAFFRRHFPVNSVIYAGMDPVERRFDNSLVLGHHEGCVASARMFGFVARKPSSMENACHVFAEFEPEQPASAVVNFINKVMLAQRRQ